MSEEITKGFQLLGISEEDYPAYSDPESFATTFKVCSLLEYSEITTSNSTVVNSPINT